MPINGGALKSFAFLSLGLALLASSFSNSLFEIFCGIFLGLSLFLVISEKRGDVFKGPFAAAAGLYLVVVALTLTQSAYPSESWRGVFRVLRCVLMSLFVVYLVDDEKKFEKAVFVFTGTAFLIGLDAMAQGITGTELLRNRQMTPYYGQTMRVTGPFTHPNDLAAYLSLVIFLFLGMLPYVWKKGSRNQVAWYVAGSLGLAGCLLWTYSRGAWLAVAAACALMAVLKRSRTMIFAMLAALVLVFFLSPAMVQMRIRSLWDFQDGTMIERKILWDEAVRMTHERPWLGHGINTYSRIEPGFKAEGVNPDYRYAHNGYLQIAAETGWLGLAAFLGVIVCFFTAAFPAHLKRQKEFVSAAALSLTLGIVSFLLHSVTDTNLQSLRLVSLLWLSMGLVLAAKKIQGALRPVRQVQRILFVRTDRMGDVLMNLPALRALRQSYPKAWIALLLDRAVAGLFRGHPDLDELIIVDAAALGRDGRKRRELSREIRKARFDVGIVSNPSKLFHWLLFSCGIPVRVGWRRKWPFLLNRTLPDTKNKGTRHEIDSNLDLVGLAAKEKWDGKIVMAEDKKAAEKISLLMKPFQTALPVVAVHPGSSNPKKIWSGERFIELCRRLEASKACQLVLIGGEEEAEVSRGIAQKLSGSPLDLTGRLSLEELAAFFKYPQVRALVSSDSGPVHVAWMSGKPVAALYAKGTPGSDPARWGPRDGKSRVLFKPMDEISVDEVETHVRSLLQ